MRLGPYQLARQIGAGGMGEVWIAHRLGPAGEREAVAIKRLPRRLAGDPNYRRILLDEARLSALLQHPNIVHTIEAGEADGEVFIAMELIDGLDLSRVTKLLALRGERLAIPVAAYVVVEVLRGLAYAHNLEHEGELISLVHRDVSPHNVMLSSHGTVKLADFGVARLSSEDTSGTHVKGKARYMPPEQLRGDSRSPTVDLFAVGAMLQELLDGAVFRGDAVDDARLLGMAIDGVIPPLRHPREIPVELDRVRRRLLELDPEQRLRSAQQALDLLMRWPGFRPCPRELAELVARLRQQEAELVGGNTQTGLAHQATFLHTRDLELDGSDLLELANVVEAPDQILLALVGDASESATRIPSDQHTRRTPGTHEQLDRTDDTDPAATGGPRKPPRDPSLALDLSGESFARHVPTSPNPIVPPSRVIWPLAFGIVAVLGAGVAGSYALGWWPPSPAPDPSPTTTLRQARVAGRGSLLDLGLRDRSMDRLVLDDIRFDYRPDPDVDPLAVLARGEAEFALTTLDAFLDAGAPGKIVAILGVPLASEALILDSQDHPALRSLADLRSPALLACSPSTLGFARRLADALALELDESLSSDDAAVFAELERDDSAIVAGIVREPWIGKAEAAGMTVAASGLDLPLADVEVLVVRADLLAADPELVAAVVAGYDSAVVALRREPTVLVERLAAVHGLSSAQAERALAELCLFDGAGAASVAADAAMIEALAEHFEPRFTQAAAQEDRYARSSLDECLASAEPRTQLEQPLGPLPELSESPFEPEAANLTASGAEAVEQLAVRLRAFNPDTVIAEVIGYGERNGQAGRKLGSARAQQLIDALREAGVATQLRASGQPVRDAPASRVRVVLSRRP